MTVATRDKVKKQASSGIDRLIGPTAARVEAALRRWMPAESLYPDSIHRAMRYSLFAGGKRLRPLLVVETARMLGGRLADALPAACALECIHTYSLIHDDLPAMDDDDFRRGKPSNHKVFGEAMAILAGDGLLTYAFELVAAKTPTAAVVPALVKEIGIAAGTRGMVGGQVADLEAENGKRDAGHLEYIHLHKTAALITCATRCGAISARASKADLALATRYGKNLGLAFQVVDDILDVVGTTEELGKTAGKDADSKKLTYPSVYGIERSREVAKRLVDRALAAVRPFGARGRVLAALAEYVRDRSH
ncbi:MAG: polyprenyl synthetase family protein [Planctomycetota bacterium]